MNRARAAAVLTGEPGQRQGEKAGHDDHDHSERGPEPAAPPAPPARQKWWSFTRHQYTG
jgi:hypothetical protein